MADVGPGLVCSYATLLRDIRTLRTWDQACSGTQPYGPSPCHPVLGREMLLLAAVEPNVLQAESGAACGCRR